jgi:ammonia channel protein AmtB
MDYKVMLDTIWVIIASMLVFFMNLGFAMVESGFNRSKKTLSISFQRILCFFCCNNIRISRSWLGFNVWKWWRCNTLCP